jgi:NAD(P)H-flavin reductase
MTMTPLRYRVDSRQEDTDDTVTLVLTPVDRPIPVPLPGQFTMVYAFGVGEVPISVSGRAGATGIVHTLRAVGAVTRALHSARPGDVLGVRGPYGIGWVLPAPRGADVVVMAGGIGLAPLRPVIRHTIDYRDRYGRVAVLVGARTPGDLLYPDEYEQWRGAGIDLRVAVDRAANGWTGHVGVVTTLLDGLAVEPARTTAFVCGLMSVKEL